jgi:hypothetical protein
LLVEALSIASLLNYLQLSLMNRFGCVGRVMLNALVIELNGSLKQRKDAIAIPYAYFQSVLIVRRGLIFRRCVWMDGIRGVF